MMDWDRYPHFKPTEMQCRGTNCCGNKALMSPDFMLMLESLRIAVDEPFVVMSAYRCITHNQRVGGGVAHPTGRAVDIAADGRLQYKILKMALLHGFTGIGINASGGDRQFIHLDTLTPIQAAARPNVWSYS